jgi:hypothetical protein
MGRKKIRPEDYPGNISMFDLEEMGLKEDAIDFNPDEDSEDSDLLDEEDISDDYSDDVDDDAPKTRKKKGDKAEKKFDWQSLVTDEPGRDMQTIRVRGAIKGVYDIQKVRIGLGNRIVSNTYSRLGISKGKSKKDMDTIKRHMLDVILGEYTSITDAMVEKNLPIRNYFEDVPEKTLISSTAEYNIIRVYRELKMYEDVLVKEVTSLVSEHRLWNAFFKDVKCVGPMMAGICISEFNIFKARHVSSFYKYAGLDVVLKEENGEIIGEGRSVKREHMVKVEYVNKKGENATRDSLTYNPFLKSKLVGVLGGSLMRKVSPYRKDYDGYLFRLQNSPKYSGDTKELKSRRQNMARRYIVKCFLRDLWVAWRTLEGLEVTEPYEVAKLGMRPHGANRTNDGRMIDKDGNIVD